MKQIALISQTLRAAHCHAYLNAGSHGQAILTSTPSAFADYEFVVATRLIAVSPPPELLPTTGLAAGRIFRSALGRARAGSRLGAWLERTIKRFARPFRSAERLARSRWPRKPVAIDKRSIASSAMYAQLEKEHSSQPIDRLVVFDLFDLPVAMAFAEEHNIEVLVR